MSRREVPVIIPVENQVRELEPKLLLACALAQRGLPAIVGSRREIDFHIASFPRGFYLSKSLTVRSVRMFRILRRLGHEILAWDEEALVHLPADVYYSRRLCPEAMRYVSCLFAWGQDNVELFRNYPHLRAAPIPIHATGNPRNDFLRPELRGLLEERAQSYRAEHGDFILINTNFNHVNSFYTGQNLVLSPAAGEEPRFGRAARGMSPEYALGLRDHKQAIFEHFQELIPALEQAFPELTVIVRPHPTENPSVYQEIARRCTRVRVTSEGNVVPWLLAARALVHNGCTTGVEAYLVGVPAVSYRPRVDPRYDDGFYRLPNLASHQAFTLPELRSMLEQILAGKLRAAGGAERRAAVDHYLSAQDGPLAVQRIAAVLEQRRGATGALPAPPITARVQGRLAAALRRSKKKRKGRKPGAQTALEFHRHRFPPLSLAEVQSCVTGFEAVLHSDPLEVSEVREEIFRIRAPARSCMP